MMSLRRQMIVPVPEETERVARAAFPKGNIYITLRDELGTIYEDELFGELYPERGQPAENPWRLALVTVMQFAEGLTDRQAVDAVRGRIDPAGRGVQTRIGSTQCSWVDWKYTLSLELTDPGFHYSVLSEFRDRLVAGGADQILLERMLEQCQARGLLAGKDQQRTDSTHIVAAIRQVNRLELVGEAMRRALDDLAQVVPGWLKPHIQPEWGERYGKPFDAYRLPKTTANREALAEVIGQDGHRLLKAIYNIASPPELRALPSIETLRRIWVQQYYVDDEGDSHWRTGKIWGQPPAHRMIASPDELDARYSVKRDLAWVGYKVHLAEICAPNQPHLITHVETTVATTHDVKLTQLIQNKLEAKGLLQVQHFVDGGYLEADLLVSSQKQGVDLIGPVPVDKIWQAKTEGAFDHSQFRIDWERMTATCPNGKTSIYHMAGAHGDAQPMSTSLLAPRIAGPARFAQNALAQRRGDEA